LKSKVFNNTFLEPEAKVVSPKPSVLLALKVVASTEIVRPEIDHTLLETVF